LVRPEQPHTDQGRDRQHGHNPSEPAAEEPVWTGQYMKVGVIVYRITI
jgi:hypothetical protein